MEIKTLGIILSIVGIVFTILGSINGFFLLFIRSEIKHLRELLSIETEARKELQQKFEACQNGTRPKQESNICSIRPKELS